MSPSTDGDTAVSAESTELTKWQYRSRQFLGSCFIVLVGSCNAFGVDIADSNTATAAFAIGIHYIKMKKHPREETCVDIPVAENENILR